MFAYEHTEDYTDSGETERKRAKCTVDTLFLA